MLLNLGLKKRPTAPVWAADGLPTFHFGEGEHRTVAGGQRGNPCGVFLHDDELGWAEL